jgi:hypothetical protein
MSHVSRYRLTTLPPEHYLTGDGIDSRLADLKNAGVPGTSENGPDSRRNLGIVQGLADV